MINDPFNSFGSTWSTPRILAGFPSRRTRSAGEPARPSRFVTQSHALGAPGANPRALVIAAAVAVALVLLARRLGD